MLPLLASFALSNLKHDLGKLWAWLSHRSFWQLVSMALAAFALVQHFQLAGERRHSAKLQSQVVSLSEKLRTISDKRNEQHDVTERNVVRVERGDPVVRTVVRTIHDAPNPPDCKTPGIDAARIAL